jgi:single-strand DNA-binding protein
VSLWDTAAEEAAERITKGMRVLATGALYVRKYERRDGGEGQSIELKYATVALIPGGEPRTQRSTTGSGSGYAEDPWTTPASPPGSGTVHHVPSDPWDVGSQEPPF